MLKKTVCCAAMLLTACSTAIYRGAGADASRTAALTERLNKEAAQPGQRADMSAIQVTDDVYLGARSYRHHNGDVLPAAVELGGVNLVAATPLSLAGIAALVTQATDIPVALPYGGVTPDGGAGAPQAQARSASGFIPNGDAAGQLSRALDALRPRASEVSRRARTPAAFAVDPGGATAGGLHVDYHGPLSGFLKLVSAHFNVGWRYEDGKIQFSRNVTRSFSLVALPTVVSSKSDLNIGLSNGGSGGSSGGNSGGSGGSSGGSGSDTGGSAQMGASQNASVAVAFDFWKDLDKTLATILGDHGKYSISRSTSSVTVTAPPALMDEAASFIRAMNRQLSRQVTVRVAVYSVKLDNSSSYDFSLSALLARGDARLGLGAGSSSELPQVGSGNFTSSGIVSNLNVLLNALDKRGNVSVVTSASVTTMSGQPVPLQVGNARSYVSSTGTTITSGVSSTQVQTSSVNTGFALNVLPKVLDDGRVLLQYGVNISTLVGARNGFDSVAYGSGQQLLLPNVDQRSFTQESMLENGSTLVLAGYQNVNNTTSDEGRGDPNFKALGGLRQAQADREMLVICITPVVLERNNRRRDEG